MIKKVVKRNEELQDYNSDKIRQAIFKTAREVGADNPESIATKMMLEVEERI